MTTPANGQLSTTPAGLVGRRAEPTGAEVVAMEEAGLDYQTVVLVTEDGERRFVPVADLVAVVVPWDQNHLPGDHVRSAPDLMRGDQVRVEHVADVRAVDAAGHELGDPDDRITVAFTDGTTIAVGRHDRFALAWSAYEPHRASNDSLINWPAHENIVRGYADARRAAASAADQAERELRAAVQTALVDDVPVATLQRATRLSRARIYQIRDGRR